MGRELVSYEPPGLLAIVRAITYKQGWEFSLQYGVEEDGSGGLALGIISDTPNSYPPHHPIRVKHLFLVPAASYNQFTWIAWIFDRIRDVETHEAGEFFMVNGERKFAPHHGNGEDPYRVYQLGTLEAAKKKAGQE